MPSKVNRLPRTYIDSYLGSIARFDPYKPQVKVVKHGDIHGMLIAFKSNLRAAGLIDRRGKWIAGNARLIQLGDVVDRGKHPMEALDYLDQLQDDARSKGGRVIRLLGNHELMYLQKVHQKSPAMAKHNGMQMGAAGVRIADRIAREVRDKRIVAAYVDYSTGEARLCVHAGLSPKMRDHIVKSIAEEKKIAEGMITVDQMAEWMNKKLLEDVGEEWFTNERSADHVDLAENVQEFPLTYWMKYISVSLFNKILEANVETPVKEPFADDLYGEEGIFWARIFDDVEPAQMHQDVGHTIRPDIQVERAGTKAVVGHDLGLFATTEPWDHLGKCGFTSVDQEGTIWKHLKGLYGWGRSVLYPDEGLNLFPFDGRGGLGGNVVYNPVDLW